MSKPDPIAQLLEKLLPTYTRTHELLDRIHHELRSQRGRSQRGCDVREITTGPAGTSMKLSHAAGQLAGYSIRETTGTTGAVLRFRDGVGVNGAMLVTLSLAAGESVRDNFLPYGISFVDGLYVEVVSGVFEGVALLAPVCA